jgi:hypothetical protein
MKNFLTLLTVMVSVLLHAQAENKTTTQTTFGRYGTNCSSGRGACSFAAAKDPQTESPVSAKKMSEQSFRLKILRNSLTQNDEIKIAGKPFAELAAKEQLVFVQQDDLLLSETTLQNLQINPKYNKIAAGNYPMAINGAIIEVVFTLKSE